MNTPSHHRVHHARNYGRKNFGDVLIIWDRIFGTFQEELEDRKPLYGLNSQPVVQGTYNPLWHQIHHFAATINLATSGKVCYIDIGTVRLNYVFKWNSVPLSIISQVSPVKALFTRITGPGMVHPKFTAEGDPGTKLAHKRVTGVACAHPTEMKFDPSYPWEKRAFAPLDLYAAFQLFLVVNPFLSYLKQTPVLSVTQIVVGSIFLTWSGTTVAWLCGATRMAMQHELFR
jgi:hypothetical protein